MKELPLPFVQRIGKQFGADAPALIKSLDLPAATSVRINRRKPSDLTLDLSTPVEWCADGFLLSSRPVFTLDPAFHAGCYYPQESSSMFLRAVLKELYSGDEVVTCLDFCAAPGGKSLILADHFGSAGTIVSNEVNKSRNAILREVIAKWGCDNVVVTSSPASAFALLGGYFDCVLVDAPCSGEGMFRKDHDARAQWSQAAVLQCARTQKEMLGHLMQVVAPGGYLIFSTCTFSEEENGGSCLEMLAGGFEPVQLNVGSFKGIVETQDKAFYGYQFLPHLVPGEGFFLSVFRKKNGRSRSKLRIAKVISEPVREETHALNRWIELEGNIVRDKIHQFWYSPMAVPNLNELASAVYVTAPGIEIGKLIRDELIPAHCLAMSSITNNFDVFELDMEEALGFLRGEPLLLADRKGWLCVAYNGLPLGWVKCVAERCNNYYPREFRIRMKNPGE